MSGAPILRSRDLLLLCVVAIAIYQSLNSPSLSYTLDPSWYLDQRRLSSSSSTYQTLSPIVTDLDGDGSKEIVLVTKDLHLKILNAEAPNGDHRDVYIPEELASARLTSLNLQKGKTPVAIKTGYVVPYSSEKERSQVIVVVKEDWSVVCYDASLNLLWEKAVAHKSHELESMIDKFRINQAAVMIAPISIKEGSMGVVIVGASMALRDEHPDVHIEHEAESQHTGDQEHPEMHARASLEHFSLYALDATNGHVIWLHDGLEMRPEDFIKSLPINALHMDRRDLQPQVHHAPGISDWTIFRQSLLEQLPHSWRNPRDTSLRMAHFERRHVGARSATIGSLPHKGTPTTAGAAHIGEGSGTKIGGATRTAKSGPGGGAGRESSSGGARRGSGRLLAGHGRFTGIETPPLVSSAVLPHDASEHTEHPNVVVARTRAGLEVIALKTGAPMTSLALSAEGGRSYGDVDGDGVVDTLIVLEKADDVQLHGYAAATHAGATLQHCSLMVLSGLPSQAQLFNGSLCSGRNSLNDPIVTPNRYNGPRRSLPEKISAAAPLVLRTIDPATLVESKARDVVVAINTGIITCFSGRGVFKWQLRNAPTWSLDSDAFEPALLHFDADALRADEAGSHDTANAHMVLMGDAVVSLISREGAILASADIPSIPAAPPVLGDFDSDGVTDVIIVTADAVLGYRVEVVSSSRGLFVALVILSGIAVVAFLSNIKIETVPIDATGSKKRNVLSLARSTEEYHLD